MLHSGVETTSMYPEMPWHATCRGSFELCRSSLFELRVALDEFLGAPSGKSVGQYLCSGTVVRPPIFSDRALLKPAESSHPDAALRSRNDLNVPRDALARNLPRIFRVVPFKPVRAARSAR